MAKTCTTEKTARRQEWIENGLLELMQEKKYEQITVSELCKYLSLSRRSFYRYFRDLEDVLDSLLNHTFQNMVLPDMVLTVEELEKNFRFWQEHRDLLGALHRSGMIDKLFDYTARYTKPMPIERHLAPEDTPIAREVGLFATNGSIALIIAWYADGFQKTPAQMAQIAYRMLFKPVLAQN